MGDGSPPALRRAPIPWGAVQGRGRRNAVKESGGCGTGPWAHTAAWHRAGPAWQEAGRGMGMEPWSLPGSSENSRGVSGGFPPPEGSLLAPQRCPWTCCRRWACRMVGMVSPSLPGSVRSARGPKTPISLSAWTTAPSSAHPPGSSSPVRHPAAAGPPSPSGGGKPSRSKGEHPLLGCRATS